MLNDHADIPIVTNDQGDPILMVSMPIWVGLEVDGQPQVLNKQDALADLADKTADELLDGLADNPNILSSDVNREVIGSAADEQWLLPLGLLMETQVLMYCRC